MFRNRLFPMLVLAGLLPTPEAQAATLLVGSGSCTDPGRHVCRRFNSSLGSAPVTIHAARWTFPSSGAAVITWHGSMQCENFSPQTEPGSGVADLAFVVTRSASDPVNYEGRNGFRASMRIPRMTLDSSSSTIFVTTTFPVAVSASLFDAVPGGANTFYLRMKILRLDRDMECSITTGSFTGTFNTQ